MTGAEQGLELGPYRLVRLLGRGAMGVVYAAQHKITGRLVAVKTLELDQTGQGSADASQRFIREIQAAIALDHPNIVRCFDFARAHISGLGEVLYYAMEMIIGETLHQMLRRGPLPLPQAAAVAIDVAQALDCAHQHGIVHRDIKPANIFMRQDRQIIVTDFGICRMEDQSTLTASGNLVGTLSYMAPEQASEAPVDARADLFALGATLFFMVTRTHLRPPSAAQALQQIMQPGADLQVLAATAEVPAPLRPILTRALAYDAGQRYPDAAQLIGDLRPLAGQLPRVQIAEAQTRTLTESAALPPLQAPSPVLPAAMVPTLDAPLPLTDKPTVAPRPLNGEALFADIPPPPSPSPSEPATVDGAEPVLLVGRSHPPRPETPSTPGAAPRAWRAQRRPRPSRAPWLKRAVIAGLAVLLLLAVLPFALRLRSVQISVDSLPQGAAVRVDGEVKCITPCTVTLDSRRHAVELSIESWQREPYRRRIEPPLWGEIPPILAAMPHERVWLKVNSQPSGATLLIDDKAHCTTPCVVQDLTPLQTHWLDFVRPGCAPSPVLVAGQPGERLLLRHPLLPRTVRSIALLQLLSDAETIELDGQDRTQALRRGAMFVEAGEHLLSVHHQGRQHDERLHLQGGETYRIDLRPGARSPTPPRLSQDILTSGDDTPADEGALDDGEVVDLNRRQAPLHHHLLDYGLYLLAQGQLDEADGYLNRALSLQPRKANSHRGIIALAIARHDEQLARGQIAALLALQGDEPDADLLAKVYASVQRASSCVPDQGQP